MGDEDSKPLTRGDFKALMQAHDEAAGQRRAADMEKFMSAFPEGDPTEHCKFHQAKIDAARAEARFWEIASSKAIEKGVDGVFGILKAVITLAIIGAAFKLGLTIPLPWGK